jgi:hypothetical protein
MRNKDQILLENIYSKSILKENDYYVNLNGDVVKKQPEHKMTLGGEVNLNGDVVPDKYNNSDNKLKYPPLQRFDRERYPKSELVPVSYLNQIKEFDRGEMFISFDFKNFDEMEKEIFENGIKYPLFIGYSVSDKKVLLIEGNHRLVLANKLNIKYLPALVVRHMYNFSDEQKSKAKDVSGYVQKEGEHIPSNIKPSEVGIPSIPLP